VSKMKCMQPMLLLALCSGVWSFRMVPSINVQRDTRARAFASNTCMVERDSLPCLLERQAGSSVGRRVVILLSIGTLVGMPLQSAHAAAATAEGTDVRSAFGKGITSSTSAWPFDQIKGKRARDAEAAASAASAEEDAADGVGEEGEEGQDSGAVPMKKAEVIRLFFLTNSEYKMYAPIFL
jgi:hypothetical protein